jgi:hypothetical protein
MVGTIPWKWVGLPIVWETDVPHFWVQQTMQHLPVQHGTPTNACADGQVEKRLETPGRSPLLLAKSRGTYASIEGHWQTEGVAYRPDDIGVGPAGFGSRGDVTERRRTWTRIEGTERAYTDRRQSGLMDGKEGQYTRHGLLWSGGGQARCRSNIIRASPYYTQPLTPASFKSTE